MLLKHEFYTYKDKGVMEMIVSELTAADLTKLVSLLSEEIAVLSVRMKMYPEKAAEYQDQIEKNEKIIVKLEKMH
jgi:hypothetical protein